MGFLDRFGVGGGKLSVRLDNAQVNAGQALSGTITFSAGSRAQKITNIKATVFCSLTSGKPGAADRNTQSRTVVPEFVVTNAFTTQSGQSYDFPFSASLPAGLQSSSPGQVEYRVNISADIDGEIDPGTGANFTVIGSQVNPVAAMPAKMAMNEPFAVGAYVMAQWSDGNWHPGTVVQIGQGMYGIDWENPKLGASTWVAANQVSAVAAPTKPMVGAQYEPPKSTVLSLGSPCIAQWTDGNWYPGRVVQLAQGMYAVDWDNPKLGATVWVAQHQVTPAK